MGRRYKGVVNRQQGTLLPPSVEDYVDADNAVRAIDAYVEGLDLAQLGFTNTGAGVSAGQPAYPPGGLLKLYLYGYMQRVRSSRRLERECHRNLEVMWLLEGLTPHNKTISNFRKDNAKALKAVNRDFVELCRELDLYGRELVAIDGSFFRGNAGKKGIASAKNLQKRLRAIDKTISGYMAALDQADAFEEQDARAAHANADMEQKLKDLHARQQQDRARLEQLEASGQTQHSDVDPDARLLRKHGQVVSGYNVQIAVDSKHKLLVHCDATSDGNDTGQLAPMGMQAKAVLEVEKLVLIADSGYWNGVQLKACVDAGITPYVPEPALRGPTSAANRLPPSAFTFDADSNTYRCPQGRVLGQRRTLERAGKRSIAYASSATDCNGCPLRGTCLPKSGRHREVYRWEHEELLEEHRSRMARLGKSAMRDRAAMAEHPFGTLKSRAGWQHFLVRGAERVGGELNLMMLCYNFSRVLNILGLATFRAYLAERAARRFLPLYLAALIAAQSLLRRVRRQRAIWSMDKTNGRLRGRWSDNRDLLACG
jgi:transposase